MRGIVIAGLLVLAAGVLLVDHVRSQPPGPRDGGRPPRGERREGDGPPGRGPHGEHRPPPPPIIQALDTDKDGVLSADEIKSASANLLKLDTDKDGALSHEETRPAPPPHDDGPPGAGPRGPGGPGGPERGPGRGPGEGPRRGPRDEPRGDRDDDRGPGGPGDDRGPPPPPHGKRPELGHVLPPFVRDDIDLTEEQHKQIADLESEVKEKLGKILTADQKAQCEKLMQRGPGGPPPRGPRGPEGRGEGPGDGDGDRPPRPRRPDGEGRPQGA